MKKITFLILILFPLFSFSQIFEGGLILGFSGNQIDGDTQGGYKKLGANAGVFLETTSQKKTALVIELYYIGKGAVQNTKFDDGSSVQEFKSNLHYLEMPISILYKANNYFSFSGGISASYLLKSKLFHYSSKISEDLYDMKNFIYNALLQAKYNINNKTAINLTLSYSLTSIRNDKYWMNNNLVFSLHRKIN